MTQKRLIIKAKEQARVKRGQCDYNLGFKLSLVSQVEKGEFTYKQTQRHYGIQGRGTVLVWLRKYCTLDWGKTSLQMQLRTKKTLAQKIKHLERVGWNGKLKNKILNAMVDISDGQ